MTSDVAALLARHDKLRAVRRAHGHASRATGRRRAWDYALGCRAAAQGASDAELAALIRHARRRHGEDKGERDDYVERTVVKVCAEVGAKSSSHELARSDALVDDPDEGAPPEPVAAWLTRALWLTGDPIIGAERFGWGDDAVVWLHRRSASACASRARRTCSTPRRSRDASSIRRVGHPALRKPQALRIARQVIRLCELEEADDARDETHAWVDGFVASVGVVLQVELDTAHGLWDALGKQRAWQPDEGDKRSERRTVAERTAAMRDEHGGCICPPRRSPSTSGVPSARRSAGRTWARACASSAGSVASSSAGTPTCRAGPKRRRGVFYAEPVHDVPPTRRELGHALLRALGRVDS